MADVYRSAHEPPFGPVIPAEAGIHILDFSPGVKCGYFYMLAGKPNGTLYVGVTSNLVRRVSERREGIVDGFTKRYGVHRLVYFERFESIVSAISREKQMKKWRRAWKVGPIQAYNPERKDLYGSLVGEE